MKSIVRIFAYGFISVSMVLYFAAAPLNDWAIDFEDTNPSYFVPHQQSFKIQNAKRLPAQGPNFKTYSPLLSLIGRTHVHDKVKKVIIGSYQLLEKSHPNRLWVYGETGWKQGTNFWPHKTHRNGLSVDFMAPVIKKKSGLPTHFPTHLLNHFGYNLRFDDQGKTKEYQIDFDAIINHLAALKLMAPQCDLRIKRIIIDPPLLKIMEKSKNFHTIKDLPFMSGKAWFPHDSHYHVDFEIK